MGRGSWGMGGGLPARIIRASKRHRVSCGQVPDGRGYKLAELGYAEDYDADSAPVAMMAQSRKRLVAHVLGDRRADVMAARERLVERLKRAVA